MNVINLKTMIYNFLTTLSSRVFDSQAPPKVEYPYIVYSLESSDTDENEVMEIFELVIDVYDNNQFDSTVIDTLVGVIDGNGNISAATGLHRKHYYEASKLQCDIYRMMRQQIKEDDKNMRHIELTYDVMTYLS